MPGHHAKIGQLTLENDFLSGVCLPQGSTSPVCCRGLQPARKAMTDRDHKLSLTRQAALLGINRGSGHYQPRPVSDAGLEPVGPVQTIRATSVSIIEMFLILDHNSDTVSIYS